MNFLYLTHLLFLPENVEDLHWSAYIISVQKIFLPRPDHWTENDVYSSLSIAKFRLPSHGFLTHGLLIYVIRHNGTREKVWTYLDIGPITPVLEMIASHCLLVRLQIWGYPECT